MESQVERVLYQAILGPCRGRPGATASVGPSWTILPVKPSGSQVGNQGPFVLVGVAAPVTVFVIVLVIVFVVLDEA